MTDASNETAHLDTECTRLDLADLDTWTTRKVVATIAHEDAQVPGAVAATIDYLSDAVDVIVDRLSRGGRLIYAGAGTPGRIGLLDAAECVPTFGTNPDLVQAILAGGPKAVTTAVEGAEDDPESAAADLAEINLCSDDVVVAITASGRTPYALGAARAGRAKGAATIGVSNNRGSQLSALVDVAIEVDTGPEVVAGSTRMKAGTAQKMVLNTLSTATMVRLGKTYGNLMVDLRATNEKLQARSVRIVSEATHTSTDRSVEALESADGEVKTAIVSLLANIDVNQARRHLDATYGLVRAALNSATTSNSEQEQS